MSDLPKGPVEPEEDEPDDVPPLSEPPSQPEPVEPPPAGPMSSPDPIEWTWKAPTAELIPAWFTGRMMHDVWHFGLLLTTGDMLCISHIIKVTRDAAGDLWLDVDLLDDDRPRPWTGNSDHRLLTALTSRTTASVKVSSIVAAIELADT